MSFSVCSLCSLVYNVFLFYFLLFDLFLFVFLFVFSHYLQGFDELNNIHLVCACMIDTDQKLICDCMPKKTGFYHECK